jgi:choline dehydrogenase-like flavoprotein
MMTRGYTDGRTVSSDQRLRAEVVVIGTGAGGAVMGRELAEAGLDVLLLEEGPYATVSDYGHLGPLEATRLLYRDQGLTASRGSPPLLLPVGRCVGGTTVINLGTALRMQPEHFEHWRRAGIQTISWPLMESAYDRVGGLIPVAPVPEEHQGSNTRILRDGAKAIGLTGGEVLPRSAPNCCGSARCFLGCPTDAKQAVHLNYIPRALKYGARLLSHCRVEKIIFQGQSLWGVEASILGPNEKRRHRVVVHADRVVVACGALLSPILLNKSGVTDDHKQAGQNLGVHPACRAIGLYDEPVNADRGVPQAYHVPVSGQDEMYLETAFLPPALMAPALPGFGPAHHALVQRYDHLALAGFRIIETQRGSVRRSFFGLPVIDYEVSPRDLATILKGLTLSARILFETGAKKVFVPVHGMEVLESVADLAKLSDPRIKASDLELSGYHVHGTLRMGQDPQAAVVAEDGQVHGAPGVYVADASLFPTSSRVNPQLTVMALATLVSRNIIERETAPRRNSRPPPTGAGR